MDTGAGPKKVLYVGGLADEVDQKVLQAAFIPFGDIVEVNMPMDFETEKHRGFAFIEFELQEDAQASSRSRTTVGLQISPCGGFMYGAEN